MTEENSQNQQDDDVEPDKAPDESTGDLEENAADSVLSDKDPEEMTEEELRAQLAKHFREQKVEDVLVQFLVSLSNLAYSKMGLTEDSEEIKDLAQASLAIDAFKALLDAAGKRLPEQEASALAGALSSMQITFVKAES
ncbi:MAG: DUF1844 domain-containing protein [Thermoleophilia bacterium]|nr:DUF1844 domain-containing protein [Thermoleophilia bacterium]